MRASRLRVRHFRSVRGAPVTVDLATGVTALVGPNLAGKSNLVRALLVALDPAVGFDPVRDVPSSDGEAASRVEVTFDGTLHGDRLESVLAVEWAGGIRHQQVRPGGVAVPAGRHRVVYAEATDELATILTRARGVVDDLPALAQAVATTVRELIPEIAEVRCVADGAGVEVTVVDTTGVEVTRGAGLRGAAVAGVARLLAARGHPPSAVVVEEPEAFLHPAAQERLRDLLTGLASDLDTTVVVTTESPFVVPRDPSARVVAVARDVDGATRVVGSAAGDQPQAPLLGGLFRDAGFAGILDRTQRLAADVRGVLVVEGGTDVAYLQVAARVLGREEELDGIALEPAGGAMPAALSALVLRAETDLPVLALLDNDGNGRRAYKTLAERFGFERERQVMTYAEVVPDSPTGTEAEDLFDWRLVRRFVDERGPAAVAGQHELRPGEWHYDLTSSSKSAFVSWVSDHVRAEQCHRWGLLLDLLGDRLRGGG